MKIKTPVYYVSPCETCLLDEIQDSEGNTVCLVEGKSRAEIDDWGIEIQNVLNAHDGLVAALRKIAIIYDDKGVEDMVLSPEECCEEMADIANAVLAKVRDG